MKLSALYLFALELKVLLEFDDNSFLPPFYSFVLRLNFPCSRYVGTLLTLGSNFGSMEQLILLMDQIPTP